MEALAILKILLIVFVLGSTLYSVIVYQGRKKSSLKSLTAFRRDAVAARKLDPTEQRLVDTLLEQTDRKTVGRLTGDDVYPLRGNYLRHGLETNGNTVWHDTIGGVEVLLPYDAEYFLREHNDALVVLADKQAIVIALNEDFDLAGAVDREQRREQKQNQWDSGEYGELSSVFRDPDEPEDREGPSLTIRKALELEYRFTHRSMEHGDFLEGIRAQIIDKDRNPNWQFNDLDVPGTKVTAMLEQLGADELTF